MSYTPIEAREGVQPIALAANSQNHPPGTIVRAFDPSTVKASSFICSVSAEL